MKFYKRSFIFIAGFTFFAIFAKAQDKPIGYWESHLPYNIAIGVATNGSELFTICDQAFFTFDGTNVNAYSKVEGMSDIGMQCIAYDGSTSNAILVYTNGNIDLFKNNTFYNIPDLKVKTVAGSKTVNQVYTENGIAYLSTSLGVLVIDLNTRNFIQTYQYNIGKQVLPVNSFISSGNYFYAATQGGVYRADKNSPALQNFQVWQRIDSVDTILTVTSVNNVLFLANHKTVFALINDSVKSVYTSPVVIQHIDPGVNQLLVSEFDASHFDGYIRAMDTSFRFVDSVIGVGNPMQAVQLGDNTVWVADAYYGLEKRSGGSNIEKHNPDGPSDPSSFDIYVNNKDLWVAHGGYDDKFYNAENPDGISNLKNGKWAAYKRYVYRPFDTLSDFVSVFKDESKGTVYFGSYNNGVFILNPDGTYQLVNVGVFDTSASVFYDNQRQVTGVALDNNGNVWATAIAQHQLYALSASDGNWYKFLIPGVDNGGPITIDDNGQVWFISNSTPGGVTVYNANGTIGDPSDDYSYHLSAGVGSGNLPSNNVHCVAKDNNNEIWIGTDNGIGIVSNCVAPFNQSSPPCDANIPIVQYDQFAGYLFAGSNVRSIAVDGANRKWVGTDDGIWLLSPDASKILYRFTQDNSPLPSNIIQKIAIDNVTGDVYIGTSQGLVSYHSTATDGGTTTQNVLVFPNPVQSGYSGTIAIKGLVANADVRITDIDGQLVYKTKALGGQAVWNGRDYTGHKPQSGVYLIFASGSDGSQTFQGKIVFMQ